MKIRVQSEDHSNKNQFERIDPIDRNWKIKKICISRYLIASKNTALLQILLYYFQFTTILRVLRT